MILQNIINLDFSDLILIHKCIEIINTNINLIIFSIIILTALNTILFSKKLPEIAKTTGQLVLMLSGINTMVETGRNVKAGYNLISISRSSGSNTGSDYTNNKDKTGNNISNDSSNTNNSNGNSNTNKTDKNSSNNNSNEYQINKIKENLLPLLLNKTLYLKIKLQIQKITNNLKNKIRYYKFNLKYSYILPFIINSINNDIPEKTVPIVKLFSSYLVVSIFILASVLNIINYLVSLYILKNYKDSFVKKYGSKIPFFFYIEKSIKFYEKTSVYFIVFEVLICIILLSLILFTSSQILIAAT